MDQLESLRPAGLLERYHITRCELGLDSCVIASARYVSRTNVSLCKARIFLALEQVVLAHTALGTQIVGESSGKPSYVRLRSIDLSQVVEYTDGISQPDLRSTFTYYLARPFKIESTEPLWRVGILSDGTVIFVFHHAIGDGQSGLSLHKAFLTAINNLPDPLPEPTSIITLPPGPVMLPAVETMTNVSVPFRKLCHEIYGLFAPASWREGYNSWTGNPVVLEPTMHTHIRLWEIPSSQGTKLVQLCREHECTLTSFLYVLAAECFSRLITTSFPNDLTKYKTLSTNVAVSLRRFTGTPAEQICDQSSKLHQYIPITTFARNSATLTEPDAKDYPWTRAQEFKKTFHEQLGTVRQDIGAMGYLFGHFREYFTGMLGKKREGTFTISNIGRFPSDVKGGASQQEWSITGMFFGQCDATCGTAVKLNVVGSPDESIGITVTWGDGAMDSHVAESFLAMMKQWTTRILEHVDS